MHLEGSQVYARLLGLTDLFYRDTCSQFLLFSDFGLLLELPNSSNVLPMEIFAEVSARLGAFGAWASEALRCLESQVSYRERETLRLVLQFDADRNLFDQSGPFFAGLR